jgi:type II secretory pathway component PulK
MAGHRRCARRRGTALMLAVFVMAVASMMVITILDTQTLQYSALRNTMHYDRARYLAEAGLHHAMSLLESDFDMSGTTGFSIPNTEYPVGSGSNYSASISAVQADGTRVITATGTSNTFTRTLTIQVKMGG